MSFLRREEGSLSVEAVLVIPVLFFAFLAMTVFWDVFRTQSVNLKAAYTISDMISRETVPIDAAYVTRMNLVYDWLTDAARPTRLRVSVVTSKLTEDGDRELKLLWSEGAGGPDALADVEPIRPHLPVPGTGDQVIVVETFLDYEPAFDVGISDRTFSDVIVTRPRFVPQVLWSDRVP